MKAIVRRTYGNTASLALEEVDNPAIPDDGILVRVRAASLNFGDWYSLMGAPWIARPQMGLRKPKSPLIGSDFAGTVAAVGQEVREFQPGDEVFGGRSGALAELVSVRLTVVRKPPNVSFEEASAVPVAGITALQGLRDKGQLQPGQHVLINGASGGVGTLAVQIAKHLGAEVTGVCSPRNVELVRSLGADHVVDYTKQDFTRASGRYDLLLDVAGGRPWSWLASVMAQEARIVIVGGQRGGRLLGPLANILRLRRRSRRSGRTAEFFIASFNKEDFGFLGQMLEDGRLKPFIDKSFAFEDYADAFAYLGEGHARGKIVLTL